MRSHLSFKYTVHMVFMVLIELALFTLLSGDAMASRNKIKLLHGFEKGNETQTLERFSDNVDIITVQDYGVTQGRNCARVTGEMGKSWASFELRGKSLQGWQEFDYIAVDVYSDSVHKLPLICELWDKNSKNYHTRSTAKIGGLGDTPPLFKGRNTLVWRINRAKRNQKEARSWQELKPEDKIDLGNLKKVKFFFTPRKKGGNTVFWMDNIRLLQEDALGHGIEIALPKNAVAYDFGPVARATEGFTSVTARHPALSGEPCKTAGKLWPDPLTGNGIESASGAFSFDVKVPQGEYLVWISAGKTIQEKTKKYRFLLKVGDQELYNKRMSSKEFYGEEGLFRHLSTQFSMRENALWEDYVEPAAPAQVCRVKAGKQGFKVTVSNHRLSALIVVPATEQKAFDKMVADIKASRIKHFNNKHRIDPFPEVTIDSSKAYEIWSPKSRNQVVRPWSRPQAQDREVKKLSLRGSRGRFVTARVCVSANRDLGMGDIVLSDLKGPGHIPASAIRRYHQAYWIPDTAPEEMCLNPKTKINFEKGHTWAYWLWLEIPQNAKAGDYKGTLSFRPEKGGVQKIDIELEVYPFDLIKDLPVSYGMYYNPWKFPKEFDSKQLMLEQHHFMREVGFTASCVQAGRITEIIGKKQVRIKFDPLLWEVIREAGLSRTPDQQTLAPTLSFARQIARMSGLGSRVDEEPGIEFTLPELGVLYKDALRQYRDYAKKMGLPIAFESVDEPREVPNPWNRNLVHTNQYGDWIKEVGGMTSFVTPMTDSSEGVDYSSLADHADIVSIHAWELSKKLLQRTRKNGRTLWFYNTGTDRFSWGFYNWKMDSKGRWEWHFAWNENKTAGYPCPEETYTPFAGQKGLAKRAPYHEHRGGFLFNSNYLDMCEGINDYAYLVSLEAALQNAEKQGLSKDTVAKAKALMKDIRSKIPDFAKIKGMDGDAAAALVGGGLDTPAAEMCPEWRAEIAELLKQFAKATRKYASNKG